MPDPFQRGRRAVSIQKKVYTMASSDGVSAEITMYGDIYEQQPTDWWGDPIEGQFITLSEFLADLGQLDGCKDITIRMNSYGGDAGASNTIHNRLRELARNGAKLSCIVDGVAMSGGSLIMCACDTVRVNPSSLIMIHKCWTFLWGGYNADELRDQATQQDAWDKMQVEVYKRKCGLSDTVIMHLMSATTYMTGREAVEKGFADELIEDAEPVSIAASADGRSLFVRGRRFHLAPGMFAPDSIPTAANGQGSGAAIRTIMAKMKADPEAAVPDMANRSPDGPGSKKGGDQPMEAKTVEELRAQYPELTAQLEAQVKAAALSGAAGDVEAERRRLQEIDALAPVLDPQLVREAKYGEHPCTAQELAYCSAQKAAQTAAGQGRAFLSMMEEDAINSGAQGVGVADSAGSGIGETPPTPESMTPEQRMASARAQVKAIFEQEG